MTVKAGWKGAVYIGGTKIGGSTSWTYSGETRNMQDIDEFQDEIVKQLPLQIVGGDIEITGNYLLDTDVGQKLLKTNFDAKTEMDNVQLHTDYSTIYLVPDGSSHCVITKVNATGTDKSGVGTFSCTMHVNGQLEQAGSTTVVTFDTVGVHNVSATEAEFIGRLLHAGGLGDITCYFEYGTTVAYGTDTSGTADVMDAAAIVLGGLFEQTSALLVTATLYHWRIHATHTAGAVHVVGPDQTFTTP